MLLPRLCAAMLHAQTGARAAVQKPASGLRSRCPNINKFVDPVFKQFSAAYTSPETSYVLGRIASSRTGRQQEAARKEQGPQKYADKKSVNYSRNDEGKRASKAAPVRGTSPPPPVNSVTTRRNSAPVVETRGQDAGPSGHQNKQIRASNGHLDDGNTVGQGGDLQSGQFRVAPHPYINDTLCVAALVRATSCSYCFTGPTAAILQGADIPNAGMITLEVQWDQLKALHARTKAAGFAPSDITSMPGGRAAFHFALPSGINVAVSCTYNTGRRSWSACHCLVFLAPKVSLHTCRHCS